MQSVYVFDFLATVSAQLAAQLEAMETSVLDEGALRRLSDFQADSDQSTQVKPFQQFF